MVSAWGPHLLKTATREWLGLACAWRSFRTKLDRITALRTKCGKNSNTEYGSVVRYWAIFVLSVCV